MRDELKNLSSQIMAGINGVDFSTPGVSREVSDFARAANMGTFAKAGSALGGAAGVVADQEAAAADNAAKANIEALKAKAAKLRPENYRAAKDRDDGGYSFYDPDGNQIGIDQYAAVTGRNPAEILSDSDNPFDQQYVNDYKNTRDVITAVQTGGDLSGYELDGQSLSGSKKTPEEIMRMLIQKYPHIYGNGNYRDSYRNNNRSLVRASGNGSYGSSSRSSSSSGGGTDLYGYPM